MGMKLFGMNEDKLTPIRTNPFNLERDIQNVVELNVEELFGLELVKSELSVGKFRFDTLCFDNETHSFVIVEYKKGVIIRLLTRDIPTYRFC
jgi:RecB family endonuclease NucS